MGSRRTALAIDAARRWRERRARLGGDIKAMRRRRRWTQSGLAERIGVQRMVVARVEHGEGRLDLELLERFGAAFNVPVAVGFGRDATLDVADAAHLALQELVLAATRQAGFQVRFELATRPAEPWRSIDVVAGANPRKAAICIECWNTFGDIGAAARSTTRKVAELEAIAIARWGAAAQVGSVWVIRDTERNHALVRRYPEVFAARFPGSSRGWVEALTTGAPMPTEPGLVWCDLARGRLHAWRRG
jgi:transcriptional regulator with XRE-family HTH domain